jgi:glucokinase
VKIRIGFDVGGTNIKAGILDSDCNIISKKITPFPKELGSHNIINAMHETALQMISENNLNKADVSSLGIAIAGSVDVKNGVVIHAYNLDFHNVHITKEMSQYFPDIPVTLINDANAAAFAEFKAGALKGYNNAILLTLGTGIGGGVILNGRLFNGGLGNGVELGHVVLDMDGPLCTCGIKGCIEEFCTVRWFMRKGKPAGYTEVKEIIDAAKKGERAAVEIFDEFVENLSSALASLANLLDPEIIALGGGISLAGDILYDALHEKVEKKSFFKYPYKVVPAQLGNDAGTIGAALSSEI